MKTHFYTKDIVNICDNNHLTVDEIFKKVSNIYPQVGKSSIYRNVEELVKSGGLKKVVGAGNKALFEKYKGDHIHLIDKNSGKIIDLDIKKLNIPGLPKNFEIDNLDIKVYGKFL